MNILSVKIGSQFKKRKRCSFFSAAVACLVHRNVVGKKMKDKLINPANYASREGFCDKNSFGFETHDL